MSDLVCKINRRDGLTVQTSWNLATMQGSSERVGREMREPITRKELRVLLGLLLGSAVLCFFALWGFSHALVVVAQRMGL